MAFTCRFYELVPVARSLGYVEGKAAEGKSRSLGRRGDLVMTAIMRERSRDGQKTSGQAGTRDGAGAATAGKGGGVVG